jgi:hypothetical protein
MQHVAPWLPEIEINIPTIKTIFDYVNGIFLPRSSLSTELKNNVFVRTNFILITWTFLW